MFRTVLNLHLNHLQNLYQYSFWTLWSHCPFQSLGCASPGWWKVAPFLHVVSALQCNMDTFLHQLRWSMVSKVEGLWLLPLTVQHGNVIGILQCVFILGMYLQQWDPGQCILKGQSSLKYQRQKYHCASGIDPRTLGLKLHYPTKQNICSQWTVVMSQEHTFPLHAVWGVFRKGRWDRWEKVVFFWIFSTRSFVLNFHRWKCSW